MNHFHIDEETLDNLGLIREHLLPADKPYKDVDIIRAAIRYLGMEIALRHKETVEVQLLNNRAGNAQKMLFLHATSRFQPRHYIAPIGGYTEEEKKNIHPAPYKPGQKQEIIFDLTDYNPDESKLD